MTGAVILPFNTQSALPEGTAKAMTLPVDSAGLREIIAARYADAMNDIMQSDSNPPEKIADLKSSRDHLQETLDLIGVCAQGYFRKSQVPADVACALFDALTGDTTACTWKDKDAKRGWSLLKCSDLINWRKMRDETNPDYRKLIFIRQVLLLNDLRSSICDASTSSDRINPRIFSAYRMATEITWPKSPLSIDMATAATKLRNTCAKMGQRPVAQRVV